MSNAPRTGGATSIGGVDGEDRRKKPWWLLLLLLAALVAVVLLLLSQCGGAEERAGGTAPTSTSSQPDASATESGSPTSSSASTTTSATGSSTSPAAGSGDVPATSPLTADGAPLLPLAASAPDGSLAAYTGQAVQARGVTVLSVPADEGFWIGTSETDRVWVQLTAGGESPYQVTEGDIVDLDGALVAHDAAFAEQVGVTAAEGAEQLSTQGQHVEVPRDAVTLTRS